MPKAVRFKLTPPAKKTCETCPLRKSPSVKQQVTTEVHSKNIDVMFIAEGPGQVENEYGRPAVGPSGQILRRVVRQLNDGTEKNVAYGNIVRCRPTQPDNPTKDRAPIDREVAACKPNIFNDIERLNPKYIVLCGKSAAAGLALNAITKEPIDPSKAIMSMRGIDHVVRTPSGKEYPAIITYHFAYVIRNPISGSIFREDIARAFFRTRGNVVDYSPRGKPARILTSVKEVKQYLGFLVKRQDDNTIIAMDYETMSNTRIDNKILVIGFAHKNDHGVVIPYQHPESPWTREEFVKVKALLQKFFRAKQVSYQSLVAHNAKFESAITLDQLGVYLGDVPVEDTMLRAHALNENRKTALGRAFGLKDLSDEWLGFKGYADPDILPIVKLRNQGRLDEAPIKELCEYNAMDCYVTRRLYDFEDRMAEAEDYKDTLRDLGLYMHGPMSAYASVMERNGIRVNKEQIRFLMTDKSPILRRQREIERDLYRMASVQEANKLLLAAEKKIRGMQGIWGAQDKKTPWLFHLNKQKAKEALYIAVLGLKTKETKTKRPSFDKSFYEKNKGIPEVDLLAEWVALDKLRGTYIEGIYKLLQSHPDMKDGRVRARYNFHLTATSRTSSDSPNMQNIPKGKTPTARSIKALYITDEGNVMVCADYSQAEVRWLAEITGDEKLISAFENVARVQAAFLEDPSPENRLKLLAEGDFHRQTAAQILGKPPQDITDDERGAAKAIVFGLVYGMSSYGLASRLGISQAEAVTYQNKFLNQFPKAREWLERVEGEGFVQGFVESPIGRRRHLVSNYVDGDRRRGPSDFATPSEKYRSYEDRVCRNAPIQSIASDTNLMACIQVQDYINKNNKSWRLINIVHDSIIAEIPYPEVEEYIKIVDKIMIDPDIFEVFGIKMRVPFKADFTIGPNWGDQIDIEVIEKYSVRCAKCGETRAEASFPKNKRCEDCGSTNVEVLINKGPLSKVMRFLSFKYGYGKFWKARLGA